MNCELGYVYYFDLFAINTTNPVRALNELIDLDEFNGHCRKIEILHSCQFLQINGYMATIKIYQATDKAIRILQKYDIDNHTISRIEVARDRICNNSMHSEKLTEVFQRTRYLAWGRGTFSVEATQYLGKKRGVKKNMYVPSYTPDESKRKLGNRCVAHVEFVILTWKEIKSKLNITSIYDLGKAEDHFKELSDKYLRRAKPNNNRIKKHFNGIEVKYVNEFIELFYKKRDMIKYAEQRNAVHYALRGKIIRDITHSEVMIRNRGVGYWVKEY